MRLSEAIREGSKDTRPAYGWLGDGYVDACAMGAALIATGVEWIGKGRAHIIEVYRLYFRQAWNLYMSDCPLSCGWMANAIVDQHGNRYASSILNIVTHLNDDHRWTREAIADWVQLQEAIAGIGQEQAAEPELVEVR